MEEQRDGAGDTTGRRLRLDRLPERIAATAGRIYFLVFSSSNGPWQLWQSDGTPIGTAQVSLPFEPHPFVLATAGEKVYLAELLSGMQSGSYNFWSVNSGGTATLLATFSAAGLTEMLPTDVDGKLFFFAITDGGRHLWSTDGTAAGTATVPGFSFYGGSGVQDPRAWNGELYFNACSVQEIDGCELWKSNGTEAGTTKVKEICDVGTQSCSGDPLGFATTEAGLYFAADDGIHGRELWFTDGTTAGTMMVYDLNPGPASSNPLNFADGGNFLFFQAADPSGYSEPYALQTVPAIFSVSPTAGPAAGGQGVTLTGLGLSDVEVTLDCCSSGTVTEATYTRLRFTTPAHAPGTVNITVMGAVGSTTRYACYTYLAPPTVASIDPAYGPASGGTPVTLHGTALEGASVSFGGVPGTILSTTATTVSCLAPPHPYGAVDVVAATPGGSATSPDPFHYTVDAPAGCTATATSTTTVAVSWSPVADAAGYFIFVSSDGVSWTNSALIQGTSGTFGALTPGTSYLVHVTAQGPGAPGPPSPNDLATTILFTDDPLPASTRVKAQHLSELRNAANMLRALAGLGPATFVDPAITPGMTVTAARLMEARMQIDGARMSVGFGPPMYTNPMIVPGDIIRRTDLQDARNAVK